MKFIVFDTETTGLPTKNAKITLPDLWPHIVQFSYVTYDTDMNQVEEKDYIIQIPDNVVMDEKNISIHGITNEISQTKGVKIVDIMDEFLDNVDESYFVIGHNLEFDLDILKVELLRITRETTCEEVKVKYQEKLNNLYLYPYDKYYCTMKNSVNICKIPSVINKFKDQYKYPRLYELHNHLFGMKPQNLHNSLNDVMVTLRCFYMLYFKQDICDINREIKKKIETLM